MKECSKRSRWERKVQTEETSCAEAQLHESNWGSLDAAKVSPACATHRHSLGGLNSPKGSWRATPWALGKTGLQCGLEQSDWEEPGKGRRHHLQREIKRETAFQTLPAPQACGHPLWSPETSPAARMTQDIRLPRLQAEGRRDSPEKQKGEALMGTLCGKLLSAMSFSL